MATGLKVSVCFEDIGNKKMCILPNKFGARCNQTLFNVQSNLKRHLKRRHQDIYDSLDETEKIKRRFVSTSSDSRPKKRIIDLPMDQRNFEEFNNNYRRQLQNNFTTPRIIEMVVKQEPPEAIFRPECKQVANMPSRKPIIPGPMSSGNTNNRSLLKALHSEMKERNAIVESSAAETSDEAKSIDINDEQTTSGPSGVDYAAQLQKMRMQHSEATSQLNPSTKSESSCSSSEDELEQRLNMIVNASKKAADKNEDKNNDDDAFDERFPMIVAKTKPAPIPQSIHRLRSVEPSMQVEPSHDLEANPYYDLPSTPAAFPDPPQLNTDPSEEMKFPLEDAALGKAPPISLARAEKLEKLAKKKTKSEKRAIQELKLNSAEARLNEFEARLRARQAKIDERHAKLCLRRALLLAKEEKIQEVESSLDNDEILLREQEARVNDRERRIKQEEEGVRIKERSLKKRDEQITERLATIERRRREIEDRERASDAMNEIMKKKEQLHRSDDYDRYIRNSSRGKKHDDRRSGDRERRRDDDEHRERRSGGRDRNPVPKPRLSIGNKEDLEKQKKKSDSLDSIARSSKAAEIRSEPKKSSTLPRDPTESAIMDLWL